MPCASLSQSSASFSHASLSTQIAVSSAFRRHALASRRYLSAEIFGIVKPTPALGCRQQLCSQIGYEVPIVLRIMLKSFGCSAFPPAPSSSLPAIHQIKDDGYRLRVERNGHRVQLITRRCNRTRRFPWMVEAKCKLWRGSEDLSGPHRILTERSKSRVIMRQRIM